MAPEFTARRDARLRARIVSDRRLEVEGAALAAGGELRMDRGSGLAWSGDHLVVIQDEADFVAVIDEEAGSVTPVVLRSSSGVAAARQAGGRFLLEAILSARDWRGEFMLAFGSGGTAERERIARIRLGAGDTELAIFSTPRLYGLLREAIGGAAGPLDVQGVALLQKGVDGRDGVRLFHRARNAALEPGEPPARLSATVDLRIDSLLAYLDRCRRDPNAFPGIELANHRRYNLNDLDGAPFGFTDAAAGPEGKVVYLAVAESFGEDGAGPRGEGSGLALGVIEPDGSARYTIVVEKDGAYTRRRAEGLALRADGTAHVVFSADAGAPATLATLQLAGL